MARAQGESPGARFQRSGVQGEESRGSNVGEMVKSGGLVAVGVRAVEVRTDSRKSLGGGRAPSGAGD